MDGVNPFRSVQATWNVLEPSAGPALAEAHGQGWGVIVKEALANGRLASVDAIALAAALSRPWADVVLSGAATVEHLRSNAAALDITGGIDVDAFAGMVEPPDQYWNTRAALAWN